MTATISYKGATLGTADNSTKTLLTSGTYLEDNITIVDVSGGTPVQKKQINFMDYDGTILYAYSKAEINAMTSESDLPSNPSHAGLTAQGWNWTLAHIKTQLTAMPDDEVTVGQMYITSSGATEIDVEFVDSARLSPTLTICVNGTITVDWGDNTTADTVTGSSLTSRKAVQHTYANTGSYTISITATGTNKYTFYSSSTYLTLRKNTNNANEGRVYANCIKNVRIGNGITDLGQYVFYWCSSLESITIPSSVTSIGQYAFYFSSIESIVIPSSVTSIANYAFYSSSLESIAIPSSVTSIANYAFASNLAMQNISIPSSVTSISTGTFSNCNNIKHITIPPSLTTIGNNAFASCVSLSSITIPSSVTSIGNSAFENCYGVKEYHIKPTTLPTAGTTIFKNIVSDCIIYVPSAKLNDYKTASNWSTYASYMQGE